MSDQDDLAKFIPQAARAFHSFVPQVSWADHMAICILNSDWLLERDARIRAEALLDAADAYPGLTRDMVSRRSVKTWLRNLAEQGDDQ